jgi:lantibiotic biosynthesis protein
MKIPYRFHKNLVLRTPRLPICKTIDHPLIRDLLDNKLVMEAIYLASPVLYDECMKWKSGHINDPKEIHKISRSLVKYYSRMSSRCTPFGLFSGCTVVNWDNTPSRVTLNNKSIKRHTRFDMHYLCALSQKLATFPGIKEYLRYFPNNSIYRIGDEVRYIEYKYISGRRIHQISSVPFTPYLHKILQQKEQGITITDAIDLLTDNEITPEDAMSFIDELLAAQMLVSELEPAITGDEFIYQVIAVLERIYNDNKNEGVQEIITILLQANRLLQQIDNQEENTAEHYRAIGTCLDKLDIPYDESKLFQTDIIKIAEEGAISLELQNQLLDVLSLLNKLTLQRTNDHIQSFARRFYDRYEDKEMPLLEVLDNESGIGYLERGSDDHSPLLEGIALPEKKDSEGSIRWGLVEKYLVNKINKAYENRHFSIDIQEQELTLFTNDTWDDLPPSLAVMFRLLDAGTDTILLEHACGSSAANVLSRFAHADEAIHHMVCDITAAEQQNDPDVIYAEVIHLPESRVGNILLHPVFRQYEIPYLAQSSLDKEHQIDVSDLVISVKNGRVQLRSRQMNKQIVPRLSTAHNYGHNALPVYQFLCDIQMQKQRPALSFTWGSLINQYKFLPRVMYKNVILELATWRFLKSDFIHLTTLPDNELQAALQQFRKEWNLPRYIVLADGDNEMLVDMEDRIMVKLWLDSVKNRYGMELKEFIYPENTAVTDQNGHVYCNQLVAALIKEQPSYTNATPPSRSHGIPATREFSIGSEWLYYKFYCGIKSADKILAEAIQPALEKMVEKKLIDKFFFIRYYDPSFHIRVRFHLPQVSAIGEVIGLLHEHIRHFEKEGFIWKTQTDVYKRELERYGHCAIEPAESLFYYDSLAVLKMLQQTWGDAREQIRWIWAMRATDELLTAFGFSITEKLQRMEALKNSFATEFNADKPLKNQLNNKYRHYRKQLELVMDASKDDTHDMQPILALLTDKSRQLQPVVQELLQLQQAGLLEVPLNDLLFSYIHMLINRAIPSNPRMHEMVIYDLLCQYYRSVISKNKAKMVTEKIVEAA